MFSFIRKIFQFLKWKIYDIKHQSPKRPYGITCYVGLPGAGKTLSLAENLLRLKMEFPQAKIYTNFGFKYEDGALTNWQQLVNLHNGEDGIIFGLDEVHDIFDRKEWKSMPKTVLQLFSQNRKFAKKIICTSQSFADIVIDIRRRCHFIIECRNIASRWIFQRAFRPDDYKEKDGVYTPRRRAWRYSFIASNTIYNCFDSYKVIENIMKGEAEAIEAEPKKSIEEVSLKIPVIEED